MFFTKYQALQKTAVVKPNPPTHFTETKGKVQPLHNTNGVFVGVQSPNIA